MHQQPHRRGSADPTSDLAGYPLGRLHLNKLITEGQLKAGNEYGTVVRAYASTMGIPLGAKAGAMSEFIGGGFYSWEGDKIEVDPEEARKRIERVKERYNDSHDSLAELGREHNRGRAILIIMRDVCVQEVGERSLWANPDALGDLRLGLNCVHRVLLEKRRM